MAELDPDGFARGINDAIRALRAVYGGVRTMLDELADEIRREPHPLYQLPVRIRPVTSRSNPDEKFLRTWEGRVYTDQPVGVDDDGDDEEPNEDEDGEDEAAGKKVITLPEKRPLAFVKVVLFHHTVDDTELHHPQLLYGVLHQCRVPGGWTPLKVRKSAFRRILDVVRHDTKPGDLATKAAVLRPSEIPKRQGRQNKLVFSVVEAPSSYRLFDLKGREQVREVVAAIKHLSKANIK